MYQTKMTFRDKKNNPAHRAGSPVVLTDKVLD